MPYITKAQLEEKLKKSEERMGELEEKLQKYEAPGKIEIVAPKASETKEAVLAGAKGLGLFNYNKSLRRWEILLSIEEYENL